MMVEVTLFGMAIPFWAIILAVIIIVVIIWNLFKFALKIFLVILLFFIILLTLDALGIFSWIQTNLLTRFL